MAAFDILRTYFKIDNSHKNAQIYNFTLGGVAGTIAVTFSYPTDLVRRKLQMVGHEGFPNYKGIVDCFQ